jgi:hypothetical protein
MKLDVFCEKVDFENKTEIERTELLLVYLAIERGEDKFLLSDIPELFEDQNYSRPNISRLRRNVRKVRSILIDKQGYVRLHATKLKEFKQIYPLLFAELEEIEVFENIIPKALFEETRGYIEKISLQINACYEHNLFDGCAVLMRRLLEILLIHSYQHRMIEDEIKDNNDNYFLLEKIINNAVKNKKLDLSRNLKGNLDDYRNLGNFSAHKILYNANKFDIDKVKNPYRVDIEELLYKSGIKT